MTRTTGVYIHTPVKYSFTLNIPILMLNSEYTTLQLGTKLYIKI